MAPRGTNSGEKFAQFAYISLIESAANTLSSQKIETGISVQDKVAWKIIRIEYGVDNTLIIGAGDTVEFGLSAVVHSALTSPLSQDQGVLDYNIQSWGAAAVSSLQLMPLIKDYSNMPGGGLITSAHSLYSFTKGTSLATAGTLRTKIWYQAITMSNEDFWDLVQMHQPLRS